MSRKKTAVVTIPLANFDSEENVILLEKGFHLRRINPKEINDLVKLFPSSETSLMTALYDTEFVIEKELSNVEKYSNF